MATSKPDVSMLRMGSDLPTDRLPTLLDIVKYARKFCEGEKNKQKCSLGIQTNKTVEEVMKSWQVVFLLFDLEKFESKKELRRRIKNILHEADEVRRGRFSTEKTEAFLVTEKSSQVYDILVFKHPILTCQEFGCKGCGMQEGVSL